MFDKEEILKLRKGRVIFQDEAAIDFTEVIKINEVYLTVKTKLGILDLVVSSVECLLANGKCYGNNFVDVTTILDLCTLAPVVGNRCLLKQDMTLHVSHLNGLNELLDNFGKMFSIEIEFETGKVIRTKDMQYLKNIQSITYSKEFCSSPVINLNVINNISLMYSSENDSESFVYKLIIDKNVLVSDKKIKKVISVISEINLLRDDLSELDSRVKVAEFCVKINDREQKDVFNSYWNNCLYGFSKDGILMSTNFDDQLYELVIVKVQDIVSIEAKLTFLGETSEISLEV